MKTLRNYDGGEGSHGSGRAVYEQELCVIRVYNSPEGGQWGCWVFRGAGTEVESAETVCTLFFLPFITKLLTAGDRPPASSMCACVFRVGGGAESSHSLGSSTTRL